VEEVKEELVVILSQLQIDQEQLTLEEVVEHNLVVLVQAEQADQE
jgi:hypothetical protein